MRIEQLPGTLFNQRPPAKKDRNPIIFDEESDDEEKKVRDARLTIERLRKHDIALRRSGSDKLVATNLAPSESGSACSSQFSSLGSQARPSVRDSGVSAFLPASARVPSVAGSVVSKSSSRPSAARSAVSLNSSVATSIYLVLSNPSYFTFNLSLNPVSLSPVARSLFLFAAHLRNHAHALVRTFFVFLLIALSLARSLQIQDELAAHKLEVQRRLREVEQQLASDGVDGTATSRSVASAAGSARSSRR